jgi:hypothetical protein
VRNNHFPHLLLGRKLRTNRHQRIQESVENQSTFDELFRLVFHSEKIVAQRAMRAVALVIKSRPEFLQPHAEHLLTLLRSPDHKDLKGLVIELIPKVELTRVDLESAWHILTYLALNQNEQRTIRTHALQSLYELTVQHYSFRFELKDTLNALSSDLTPSVNSKVIRIKMLLNKKEAVTINR